MQDEADRFARAPTPLYALAVSDRICAVARGSDGGEDAEARLPSKSYRRRFAAKSHHTHAFGFGSPFRRWRALPDRKRRLCALFGIPWRIMFARTPIAKRRIRKTPQGDRNTYAKRRLTGGLVGFLSHLTEMATVSRWGRGAPGADR